MNQALVRCGKGVVPFHDKNVEVLHEVAAVPDLPDGLKNLAGMRAMQHSFLSAGTLGQTATLVEQHRRHRNSIRDQSYLSAHTPPTIHIQQIAVCSLSKFTSPTHPGCAATHPKTKDENSPC